MDLDPFAFATTTWSTLIWMRTFLDLDYKQQTNESDNSVSMNTNTTNRANVSTPINENNRDKEKLNNEKQKKCNSKTEEADMLNCNVIPLDNDDDESSLTGMSRKIWTTKNMELRKKWITLFPRVLFFFFFLSRTYDRQCDYCK